MVRPQIAVNIYADEFLLLIRNENLIFFYFLFQFQVKVIRVTGYSTLNTVHKKATR